MKKILLTLIITIAVFIGVLLGLRLAQKPAPLGGAYDEVTYSTTTPVAAATTVLKTKSGQLVTLVVTKTDTGTVSFYNATTSDITKRTGGVATSTILIANFPTGATAGTYNFSNASFSNGLLMVTTAGFASSTITWK
jgi:hypothetical protein